MTSDIVAKDHGSEPAVLMLRAEYDREVYRVQEERARNVDAQSSAVAAAVVAIAAVTAAGDLADKVFLPLAVPAAVGFMLALLAGGVMARLPAPASLRQALKRDHEGKWFFSPGTARRLAREVREADARLDELTDAADPAEAHKRLLACWRARREMARFRAHNKSSWLTLSLTVLIDALVLAVLALLLHGV